MYPPESIEFLLSEARGELNFQIASSWQMILEPVIGNDVISEAGAVMSY